MTPAFAPGGFLLLALALLWLPTASALNELAGLSLRCCVVAESPYVMVDPARPEYGNWNGVAIDYLSRLQLQLGFTCSSFLDYADVFPSGDLSGSTGLIRHFNSCAIAGSSKQNCKCDIGIGAWSLTSTSFGKVDFIYSFSQDNFQVVTRQSLVLNEASSNLFFLQVFTWKIWLAIAGLYALHLFVTSINSKFAPADHKPLDLQQHHHLTLFQRSRRFLLKHPALYKLRHGFFNTMFHAVGQQVEPDTHKSGFKEIIMNLIMILFYILIITIFQASVTAQLFTDVPASTFKSVDDFKTCKVPASKVCVLNDNSDASYIWNNSVANSLGAKCPTTQNVAVQNLSQGLDFVNKSRCDYLFAKGASLVWETSGRYCNQLVPVGKNPYYGTQVSFIVPYKSNLTGLLSNTTIQLMEQDQLIDSLQYAGQEVCKSPPDPKLGWDKLQIFFYIAFALLVIMALSVFISRVTKHDAVVTAPNTEEAQVPEDFIAKP